MIGRFGFGNKRSSSKEPRNSDTQSVFGAHDPPRVSQQVSPSQSSPNFFSLPIWRRRNPQTTPSTPNLNFDDFGTPARRSSCNVPLRDNSHPLPSPASDYRHGAPWLPISDRYSGESHAGPSRLAVPRPSDSSSSCRQVRSDSPLHSSQPKLALARAALGLGLPYVIPGQVPLSEINSIAFVPDPASPNLPPESIMRRAKSFQNLASDPPREKLSNIVEHRRNRGLSLGPVHFDSEGKVQEREHDLTNGIVPPTPKVVSRKPSFWRRRNESSKTSTPDLLKITPPLPKASLDDDSIPRPQPSLPSLRPLSPFTIDTSTSMLQSLSVQVPPTDSLFSMQRRHSERVPSLTRQASSGPLNNVSSKPSTRRRKVPRPATADPTSGNDSSFVRSAPTSPSTPIIVSAPLYVERSESLSHDISKSRPRAQTNPPFFHRLSMNLFSSSAPSPPVPPLSTTPLTISPAASSSNSPRPSTSKYSVEIPKPLIDEESPKDYVDRLTEAVNKADVASVLASSGDDFNAQALRIYISRFDFSGDPLDVALRKLLMHVGLPRETQQIDRVIEAFAFRYSQCNPTLFTPHDHSYILAFSLIMLHTDVFNKSNKHKMTKADYIKNTSLPGIAPEVLDCFYHNIVFAPFIFIEDPVDFAKERNFATDGGLTRRMSTFGPSSGNHSGTTLLGKSAHIDPYYLITRNALGPLRVDVQSLGPLDNPYSYELPENPLNAERIHNHFVNAISIEVSMDNYLVSPAFFSIPSPMVAGSPMGMTPEFTSGSTIWTVKLIKYGLLGRKDDTVEGGKRAINRKWKEWSVILTGSQLLLYRDPAWVLNLLERLGASVQTRVTLPRPDELMPLKDAIAVHDKSYIRRVNTLRFALLDGRQTLFQAADEKAMYDWIAHINYASAFKTADVRVRSGGLSREDIELTGIAAATSHLREMDQRNTSPPTRIRSWNINGSTDGHRRMPSCTDSLTGSIARGTSGSMDLIEPISPQSDGSSMQFKATFDHVKADLAGGFRRSSDNGTAVPPHTRSFDLPFIHSPASMIHSEPPLRPSSRTRAIKQRIRNLDTRISEAQSQIDSDLRFVRNVVVLTPFQRATRDRLQAAVNHVAKRIIQERLEAAKLVCHRDILSSDLVAEEAQWQQTKDMALNAAREVLQNRAMTLPDTEIIPDRQLSPIDVSESSHELQSVEEKFFSTLDIGDSPVGASPGLFTLHGSQQSTQSPSNTPLTEANSSVGSFPFHRDDDSAPSSTEQQDRQRQSGHERFYTAPEMPEERAEEWNKTKAAKRVSLVQVPSSLRMLKPLRSPDGGTGSPSSRSGGSRSNRTLETVRTSDV